LIGARQLTEVVERLPVLPRRPRRGLGFILVVLLPTAVAALYLFAVAADQYVAEFRFTLSTAEPPRSEPLALLTGAASQPSAALQSQVLVQYIASRAMLDRIGAAIDLRRLFAPPAADRWSRLAEGASIEELVRYWRGQVDPFYDPANGTVTVRVRAFEPADTLSLAQAIVAASEELVNELSQRLRHDALREAEGEVARAQDRLRAAQNRVGAFRDHAGMIDPDRAAAQTGQIADRLRGEVVRANAELATLRAYMSADAPSVRLLQARIRSLEAQRRLIAHEMTGASPAQPATLSTLLGSYEQLDAERRFAEAAYQHALQGLDTARANADRQQVYLASFIPPSRPEEALYPRRWRDLGTIAVLAFALWGIGGLAVRSVRDHLT
jgi:capsular polysaccharide transport system permease protein